MTAPHPHRRHRLVALVATVALVVALPALTAQAAPSSPPSSTPPVAVATKAAPKTAPHTTAVPKKADHHIRRHLKKPPRPVRRLRSQAPPQADFSASQPQTMRDDITGDFGGLGYDQRMRVETGQLKRWAPTEQGGAQTAVPTDLNPAPENINFNVRTLNGIEGFPLNDFASFGSERYQNCGGCFEVLFDYYHLNTVYLATLDGYVYVLGTKGSQGYNPDTDSSPPADQYRVVLYQIAMNQAVTGCANESCAVRTYDFPTSYNLDESGPGFPRSIGPASIAAGHIAGVPYLAVGMTDGGVYILNTALQVTSQYLGIATPDGSQTVPTALAWDPAGSGLLAVGTLEWAYAGFFPVFNSAGQLTGDKVWTFQPGQGLVPFALSAAIVPQANGNPAVAFGMSDGNLRLIDPTVTGNSPLAVSTDPGPPGGMVAISPIPRVNTSVAGGPDLAVSYQSVGDVLNGSGALFRWDGGTSPLTHVPIAPNNGPYLPRAQYRSWFPGTKQGRITIQNTSAEPVTVSIASDPAAGSGCWWAPAWADAAAFPARLTVLAGATSARFTIGMLTSGDSGNCGASDATGTKRAYLVVAPVNRPADQQIVELQITDDLQLTMPDHDQAGSGSTTVGDPTKGAQYGALGAWNVVVDSSALPTPSAAPVVTTTQLTPGPNNQDNPAATSAVYKFAVQPITWTVPGLNTSAGSRLQVVLPPLSVEGYDGSSWQPMGSFMPIGAVKVNPPQGTVTTSGGTFYWENATVGGQKFSYSSVRVTAGTGPNAPSTQIPLTAGTPSRTWQVGYKGLGLKAVGAGSFAANGVDAYPLAVSVATTGTVSSDPSQSVYYRLANLDLVTNLYVHGQESSYVGVQPSAPAYPNTTGSQRGAGVPIDYAVSASSDEVDVKAGIWAGTPNKYVLTDALPIQGTALSLGVDQGNASGFTLESCSAGCAPADIALTGTDAGGIAHAALYQAGPISEGSLNGPPAIGVLVDSLAVNDAINSLPLVWTASSSPTVATSTVTLATSTDSVSVDQPGVFPAGPKAVRVPVVSRGLFAMPSIASPG